MDLRISPWYLTLLQTKKKRSSRRMPLDAEEEVSKMRVDEPVAPRVRDLDANFVDDDDLHAPLARARHAKLHKEKKLSPEELARKRMLLFFVLWLSAHHF